MRYRTAVVIPPSRYEVILVSSSAPVPAARLALDVRDESLSLPARS